MSPFLLHFLGHPQARGRCSQGEAGCILGGTRAVWEEPRKQKPRSALFASRIRDRGRRNLARAVPRNGPAEKGRRIAVSEITLAGSGGRQEPATVERKTVALAQKLPSKRALDSGLYSRV